MIFVGAAWPIPREDITATPLTGAGLVHASRSTSRGDQTPRVRLGLRAWCGPTDAGPRPQRTARRVGRGVVCEPRRPPRAFDPSRAFVTSLADTPPSVSSFGVATLLAIEPFRLKRAPESPTSDRLLADRRPLSRLDAVHRHEDRSPWPDCSVRTLWLCESALVARSRRHYVHGRRRCG